MNSEAYITVYAASKQWKVPENYFEVLKVIPEYALWFKGNSSKYGQNLVLEDALPTILEIYKNNVQEFENYNQNPEYTNMGTLLIGVLKTETEVMSMIESGLYDHLFVKLLRRKKVDPVFGPYIYFFNSGFLEQCEFLTTGLIVKALKKRGIKISDATVRAYKKEGKLIIKKNRYGLDTLNLTEVQNLVLAKKLETQTKTKKQANENSNFSVLNSKQQKMIEDYLSFRSRGGRISHNNFSPKKNIANKNETIPVLKSALATFFFRIICERCNIVQKRKMRYAYLSDNEKKQYNPDVFDPLEVNVEDAFVFMDNCKTTSAIHVYQTIKPFYAWILQSIKAKASTPELWFEYGLLDRRIEIFLNQFPKNYNEIPVGEQVNQLNKSFLTREQMILVKIKILQNPLSHDPFKYATIWELCCVSGLRPYEVRKLRIEHFLLDNNGYLGLNERGWGILRLPNEASKHERSPSNPVYGTPIPPGTVKRINEYLNRLYKRQWNAPKGVGYMFRPEEISPERGYKSSVIFNMSHLKEQLDFLPIEQRKDFELKTARRSMNNLIDGYKVKLPLDYLNGKIQKVAADIQMRHKIAKDVGEESYTELIPEDDFYTVLDLTINFPWDLNEVVQWENKIYSIENRNDTSKRQPKQIDEHHESNVITEPIQMRKSSEHIARKNEIKKQLNKLRKRPKELSMEDWFKKKDDLERELLSFG